ncbi:MAG: DUF6338 family protein [Beijerinckiaceae bacterium]
MPDFKGIPNLSLILFLIVPGIVTIYVRSRFITGRMPSLKEDVLAYLVVSVLYYALTALVLEHALSVREPWLAWVAVWIGLTLIGPAIFGTLLGVLAQKEWVGLVAEKLGLSTIHVIPTAWDWRFSKIQRGGQFMMITLQNDEKVAGFFGPNSFASSDSSERDLYLEEEYVVTDANEWQPREDRVGVLIAAKEIKYIEFWAPMNEGRT